MSTFKKTISVTQEFRKCDFCDESDFIENKTQFMNVNSTYIKTCPGCGKHICPAHRKKVEMLHNSIADLELCLNCTVTWKVIELYIRSK